MNPPIPADVSGVDEAWVRRAVAQWNGRSCGALLERRPVGLDRGSTGSTLRFRFSDLDLLVKLPNRTARERAARELHFLTEFGHESDQKLPLRTPILIGGAIDPASERVALLLEYEAGELGDALTLPAPAQLRSLLRDLAALHARYWNCAPHREWIPRWGEGTRGTTAPHRRRAERFRRRRTTFIEHHGGGANLPELLDQIASTIETDLATVAALPPTLIHADIHLDNTIQRPDGTRLWLDWQSVSRGPGLYDATRLLGETIPAERAGDATDQLGVYLSELQRAQSSPCLTTEEIDTTRAAWPAMLRCVLAGFISGCAGRLPEEIGDRERKLVQRSAGDHGLAALVAAVIG